MKKQLWILVAAAMLAAALGGCGGQEDVSEPASEPTSPVSSESTPEEASGTAASDPEPAGDTPVGEFWSIPDETPTDQVLDLYPDLNFWSYPHLFPEDTSELQTVGDMKAYWASLSPEDERLREQYLTMTPEEKMLDIEHENPVLTAVGDTVEGVYGEADEPVSLTVTGIQADGYVAYIDLEGFEPGSFDFDFSMDRKVISPNSAHGGFGYGATPSEDDDSRAFFTAYADLPFVQLVQHTDSPFPFDMDIDLTEYRTEVKTAVFPRADNTREGLYPAAAQLSPLSFVVNFAVFGDDVLVPTDVSEMQPVKLLDGEEVVYQFDGVNDRAFVNSTGWTFVPVKQETATVAGEYDWRLLCTFVVKGDEENREIFPDYDRIDAIEFEGVVYPLQ